MPTCQGIARCAPAAVASPSPCGCRQAETGADAGLILQNCLGLHSSPLCLCRGSCGAVAGRKPSLVKHKPLLLPWARPGRWELVEPVWGWQQQLSRDACRYLGCVAHLPLLWAGQSWARSILETWMSFSQNTSDEKPCVACTDVQLAGSRRLQQCLYKGTFHL